MNINQELDKTLINVTHDLLIASHCNIVIWLKGGLLSNEIKENNRKKIYSEIIAKMK